MLDKPAARATTDKRESAMSNRPIYTRILIPTDGAEASQRAILAGVDFARELGAEVVGLFATPAFHLFSTDSEALEDTPAQYAAASSGKAARTLSQVASAARDAGVGCRTEHVVSDSPWEAIVEAAPRLGCDLIVMASHGRKGLKGLLLGSETQKVLVHSTVPVLVHR
jgi:nucleotide-binding universal stress UspA family protein